MPKHFPAQMVRVNGLRKKVCVSRQIFHSGGAWLWLCLLGGPHARASMGSGHMPKLGPEVDCGTGIKRSFLLS
jgi:hypothetical protein